MPVGWLLGQGPRDHLPIPGRQRGQVGLAVEVLKEELAGTRPVKRPPAGEQFLVDDGQAVLVAVAADGVFKRFRGGIDRRNAAGQRGGHAFEVLDQAEVRDLDVVADQEQVLRLDVEVLQLVLHVHQVEGLGRLFQVAQQLGARDAWKSLGPALLVTRFEVAVGQLHDDEELTLDDVEAFQRQDVRVTDRLDAAEGLQLLGHGAAVGADGLHVAVDDLDGLVQAARRFTLPDLAEAAASEEFEQAIAWYRLGTGLEGVCHARARTTGSLRSEGVSAGAYNGRAYSTSTSFRANSQVTDRGKTPKSLPQRNFPLWMAASRWIALHSRCYARVQGIVRRSARQCKETGRCHKSCWIRELILCMGALAEWQRESFPGASLEQLVPGPPACGPAARSATSSPGTGARSRNDSLRAGPHKLCALLRVELKAEGDKSGGVLASGPADQASRLAHAAGSALHRNLNLGVFPER
jgi:hypothetical protein